MANGNGGIQIKPLGAMVQALARFGQQLYQPPKDTIQNVEPDTWYSPLQPVHPIGPEGIEPRAFQYWAGQNLLWTPRADAEYSAADLKELARYPLARIAISNVQDSMCSASWEVQMRPQIGESRKAAAKRGQGDADLVKINKFFEMPDREHDWPYWLRPLLDDMLVIDAWTVLLRKTFAGEIVELSVLRGDSIVRYIDANGMTPMPPQPAYAQNWWGIPLVNLTTDQLIYKPRNIVPRNTIASQLYGLSPTEALAPEIEIGRQRLAFVLAYYTEGSTPGTMHVVPRGISTDKIAEAMQWMNSELAGNLAARRQYRMIQGFNEPGKDEQIIFSKEPLLADAFDEMHIRKVAFGYGISPQRLMKQMNRASAEASQEASEIEGLLPYFASLKSLIDHIIRRKMGYDKYEMVFEPMQETNQEKQANIITVYVSKAVLTPNEGRERLGEEPVSAPEADQLGVITGSGFVPLGAPMVGTQPGEKPPGQEGASDGNVGGKKPDGKGKGGQGADGTADGQNGDDDGGDGATGGRGKPRAPASANKPNGGKAAQAITQNRPIGFAAGTLVCEPEAPQYGTLTIFPGNEVTKRAAKPAERHRIDPGRLEPESLRARTKMQKAITAVFADMHRRALKTLASELNLPHDHLAKAGGDPDETSEHVMQELADDWEKIGRLAEPELILACQAGGGLAGIQLKISDKGMLARINTVAGDWAQDRAAELVGMKRNAEGSWVENPNPKWAITDGTRQRLRVVIRDVFASGEEVTLRQVEDRIQQAGIFSDVRASTIARNEIARAQTMGNLFGWQESGLVKSVNWELSADHGEEEEDLCNELADGSPYPIGEVPDFPAHPLCLCSLVLDDIDDGPQAAEPEKD